METLNIPMEAETIPTLISGFSAVIIFTLICIFYLWWKNKRLIYSWFIGQLIFLILSFKKALVVFDLRHISSPMLSEEVSLIIGVSALYWAGSMICMIIGIWQLSKK